MNPDEATIDGRTTVARGETILSAARRLGIDIPTLCFSEGLAPEGGCRICIVEAGDRIAGACHVPLAPGMRILTRTPRLDRLRRGVLELILSEHATERFRPDPNGNELERLLSRYEVSSSFGHHPIPSSIDASHPYLRFDPSLCIVCRRCLNTCEQIQGQFVYGIAGRGGDVRLIYGKSERFADSDCTACGACVDRCPTGAITDRDRIDRIAPDRTTESTCGYCGVGCRVRVESAGERVVRIEAIGDATVNRGHLCAKGRYAHAYHRHADRLTEPLLRIDGALSPISWPEAIERLASQLIDLRDRFGPDALGAITSSRSTNEAAYLLQKLFRTAIGTNNIDCCARVCHSSTAAALLIQTGTSAASASYADIERARTIVLAGANPTEAHPVVGARIKQAVLRGARLVVIDPRRVELADYADVHLQLAPGTNVALFNALGALLIEQGTIDRRFVEDRTEGFETFRAKQFDVARGAAVAGVAAEDARRAAAIMGSGAPVLFVHGLGLSEQTQGTESVMALTNLALLTGNIGRPGAGMLPLRGQNNVQGNADMGAMPDRFTGYQPIDDPEVRARLASIWGTPPPERRGLTIPEMIDAADGGVLKGLWVQGEDIAQSESNQTKVIRALEKLELLVVQDLFLCETAAHATMVLPSAGALEQEGTFTNGERRIQRVLPAVHPPGEARPDAEVIIDSARAMGERWTTTSPASVMDEIALVAPHLFGGVRYDRLGTDGLQWPCPTIDHPGTAALHTDGFLRGRGLVITAEHDPSPEQADEAHPFILITGRVLQHYNVGTMTRRTPSLDLARTDVLEMNPQDADALGIEDGDLARVESLWGRTEVVAKQSPRVKRGTAFLSFHGPEAHTNRLIGPHVDPRSKCPGFKVTAVRIEKRRG